MRCRRFGRGAAAGKAAGQLAGAREQPGRSVTGECLELADQVRGVVVAAVGGDPGPAGGGVPLRGAKDPLEAEHPGEELWGDADVAEETPLQLAGAKAGFPGENVEAGAAGGLDQEVGGGGDAGIGPVAEQGVESPCQQGECRFEAGSIAENFEQVAPVGACHFVEPDPAAGQAGLRLAQEGRGTGGPEAHGDHSYLAPWPEPQGSA